MTDIKFDWMQTESGRTFSFEDPVFHFNDIAMALAKTCRYGGHTKGFLHYATAEHSVHMTRSALKEGRSRREAWNVLMHDSPEGYIMDMVRPLKNRIPMYRDFEDDLFSKIAERYDLEDPIPAYVKLLDNRILMDEKAQVMALSDRPWNFPDDLKPLGIKIECWSSQQAYTEFVKLAKEVAHVSLD